MSDKDDCVEMSEEIAADNTAATEHIDPPDNAGSQVADNTILTEENADSEDMGQLKSKLKRCKGRKKENDEEGDEEVEIEIAQGDGTFMCGVVEGFYGRPWTTGQRKELFRRMKSMGMNTYLYGPKDDYKHRLYWRDLYSVDETTLLKLLIESAAEHDVLFIYAISPGLDMSFASAKELEYLKNKLLQVYGLGCKAFALLFDDIDPILCAVDRAQYASAASAQASVTNQMYELLGEPRFLFCPTEYCNSMAIPDVGNSIYLKTIGKELNKNISIMWTGPKVVSKQITVDSIKQLTKIVRRKAVIWDNIHANDYDPKRVFLGPYKGRSTELIPHLAGVLTNPNCEFESNFIAMHTLSSWWKSYVREKVKEDLTEDRKSSDEKKLDVDMENVDRKSDEVSNEAEEKTEKESTEKDQTPGEPEMEKRNEESEQERQKSKEGLKKEAEAAKQKANESQKPPDNQGTSPDADRPEPIEVSAISPVSSGVSSLIGSDDSDTDSDYSSHEEFESRRYLDSPPFDHGVYDPDEALREAIRTWLPYFSTSRLPLGKPIARSGPPLGMLSKCDVGLVSSAPMGAVSSTTSALSNDPILSTSYPYFYYDSPKRVQEFEIETLEGGNKKQDDSAVDVIGDESDDVTKKTTEIVDVEMTGATPAATPPSSITESASKPDLEIEKSSGDSDVDMKPIATSEEQEEKREEGMLMGDGEDSIKKNDPSAQMEMEEEEPMQYEADNDRDVSMATTNSEEKKVGKEETEDRVMGSLSGSSVDMATPPRQPPSANQSPERDSQPTSDNLATAVHGPPVFKNDQMTLEDIQLAVELFYLPYEHGGFGRKMIEEYVWLQQNIRRAVPHPNAPKSAKNEAMDRALEWMGRAIHFEDSCLSIRRMCNKLTTCANRALLYDLFPYFWDMKGVVSMLSSYVKWMGQFYLRHQTAKSPERTETGLKSPKPKSSSPLSPPSSTTVTSFPPQFPPPPAAAWLGADPEPWLFRGGLSGEFQRLLPITMANDLFCQVIPCSPQVSNTTYVIRPYLPTDEKAVYNICVTTGNDGTDFEDDFTGYEDLPGERLVGGLLTLSPEYCFVLEDELGICGYLVGTADATAFWKKYSIAVWPEVKEKYSLTKEEERSEKPGEEVMRLLNEIRSEEAPDSYAGDNLYVTHPAYMQISVHRRVTDPSIAKTMTVCMLSALKSHGVHGVHTTVRSSDCYMPDLYCRLGFREVRPFDPSTPTPPPPPCTPSSPKEDTFIVFGRTF